MIMLVATLGSHGSLSARQFSHVSAVIKPVHQTFDGGTLKHGVHHLTLVNTMNINCVLGYQQWLKNSIVYILDKSLLSTEKLTAELSERALTSRVELNNRSQNSLMIGLTLLVIVIITLILILLLKKSKNDPLAYQFSSSGAWKLAITSSALLMVCAITLGWWALHTIKGNIKSELADSLQTVVTSTLETVNIWVNNQTNQLESVAADPRLDILAKAQLKNHLQKQSLTLSEEIKGLRELFNDYNQSSGSIGFFLISRDGINLGSMRDENIGQRNVILNYRPELFERVLNGESLIIPPIPSDLMIENSANIRGLNRPPTMFIAIPLINEHGQVYAVITRRLDPHGEFSRLHMLGQLRNTGETYSFDREGKLLTESRFRQQLVKSGILEPDEQSILSIEIRDPEFNLISGADVIKGSRNKQLTLMAANAIRGKQGVNIEGYRDYRGVKVVGAWLWDEKLGLGITTEMDLKEAMASYQIIFLIITATLIITFIVSVVFTLLTIILGGRANRELNKAREQLEVAVGERTIDLKQAIKNQAESEHQLKLVVENIPGAISLKDNQGRYLLINKTFEKMTGFNASEVIGKVDKEIFIDSTMALSLEMELQAIESGKQVQFEENMTFTEGNERAFLISKIPVHSPGSQEEKRMLNSIVGVCLDVTEQKQVEFQLREALLNLDEQRYVLDQHAIVAVTDLKGTITFANQKFAEISGYHIDELIGQNHRILSSNLHSKDFWQQMYQTLKKGEVWHNEVCNAAKDGHLYWVETTIAAFKNELGKPTAYVAIRTDVSKRKQYEVQLQQAKEMAESSNQAKSDFLASMSHEIRTPLNGVLGMLGLMLHSSLDEAQQQRAKIAQSSAQSLLTLINDILDFSKIEAGMLDLEELDFDLRSLLEDVAQTQVFRCDEKSIELMLDVTGIDQSVVCGDPSRIRQVLLNLIGNAIKFTDEGEIIIIARLRKRKKQQLTLTCQVIDTGIGIPAERIDSLFDAFTQVDSSTTRQYGGTGLGLAICKKLCHLMNGEISVTSVEGTGSCFEFSALLKSSEQSIKVLPHVDISKLSILVVDNNATNREIFRYQLTRWGAIVTEAASAEEAITICQQSDKRLFDIALVDMQMPVIDGETLTKHLRSEHEYDKMKIVMMSSMSQHKKHHQLAELGLNGFLTKPVSTSDLFDILSIVAAKGEQEPSNGSLITAGYLASRAGNSSKPLSWTEQLSGEKPRLLLVEDNQVNQLVVQGLLNNVGLNCDISGNGFEAIAALRESPMSSPYHLVLMDCQMPELDGYQTTKKIRSGKAGKHYRDVIIIAMTANAMVGDRQKCLDVGMNDYLAKPVDDQELQDMLERWLVPLISLDTANVTDSSLTNETSKADNVKPQINVQALQLRLTTINIPDEISAFNFIDHQPAIFKQPEIFLKTLVMYIDEYMTFFDKVKNSVLQNDLANLKYLVHTIKGTSSNLGMIKVQSSAVAIEKKLKLTGKVDVDLVNELEQQVIKSIADSKRILAVNPQQKQLIATQPFATTKQLLLKQLKNNEFIAQELVDEFRSSAGKYLQQVDVDAIVQALDSFEYERALMLLNRQE